MCVWASSARKPRSVGSPQGPCRYTSGGPSPATSTSVSTVPCQSCSRSARAIAMLLSPPSRLAAGGGRGGPLRPQALRPPTVLPLVVPQARQVRQHLAAEQVDVLQRQLVGHRAEVQQRQQVAD